MSELRKYDQALKSVFSHPEMIVSLIKTFINEEWVKNLDFETLEPEKSDYITRALEDRQEDLIWKIRSNEGWIYLLFLLEFQSSHDHYMANRILTYGSLAYQELIKNKEVGLPKYKLPPVFPLVFYTGSVPWRAPTEFKDCLSGSISPELMEYQFSAKYVVLDIGHLPLERYNFSEDNLVLSLISLERSRTRMEAAKAIKQAYTHLIGKDATLKKAFEQYTVKALKMRERFPDSQVEKLSEDSMLYENADKIWDDFAEESRQEGRTEIAYEMVLKAYKKMYPTVSPQKLKARLERMTTEQLLQSLDQIIENKFIAEEIVD